MRQLIGILAIIGFLACWLGGVIACFGMMFNRQPGISLWHPLWQFKLTPRGASHRRRFYVFCLGAAASFALAWFCLQRTDQLH